MLKSLFRTDYRGVSAILADWPHLCAALELKRVPHFTTLHKAHVRILSFGPFSQLLDVSVRLCAGRATAHRLAAGDSTGLEAGQISPYFVKRRGPRPDTTQGTTYTALSQARAAVRYRRLVPHGKDPQHRAVPLFLPSEPPRRVADRPGRGRNDLAVAVPGPRRLSTSAASAPPRGRS